MSIAAQQNAILDKAKQEFGKTLDEKITAVDAASPTFAEDISQALKDVVKHIQNEYGYAISFYIAHDFQNHINADPNSPFKMDLEFVYVPGGANPHLN